MKNYSVILFIFLLISCGARKTDTTKDTEKTKEVEKIKDITFDYSKFIEQNSYLDKGVIFIREFNKEGKVSKETFEAKNVLKTSQKTILKVNYKSVITYKTITTYKSLYQKNTQKEQVSNWVFYVGIFFVFLFALIVYFTKKGNVLF